MLVGRRRQCAKSFGSGLMHRQNAVKSRQPKDIRNMRLNSRQCKAAIRRLNLLVKLEQDPQPGATDVRQAGTFQEKVAGPVIIGAHKRTFQLRSRRRIEVSCNRYYRDRFYFLEPDIHGQDPLLMFIRSIKPLLFRPPFYKPEPVDRALPLILHFVHHL